MAPVPELKKITLKFVGENINLIFSKSLAKIDYYLRDTGCDLSEDSDDEEEESTEKNNNLNKINTLYRSYQEQLEDFTKSINSKISWDIDEIEKHNKNTKRYKVTLVVCDSADIGGEGRRLKREGEGEGRRQKREGEGRRLKRGGVIVISRIGTSRRKCKAECSEAMVKRLYSLHLNNKILSRHVVNKSSASLDSLFRTDNLKYTVLNVDELKTYNLTEEERHAILKAIPPSILTRSHLLLIMKPSDKSIDFSFCRTLFSIEFLCTLLKKADFIEKINCENCGLATSHVYTILTECVDLMELNINNCTYVSLDTVLNYLVELDIDLKSLKLSRTFTKTYQGFEVYMQTSLPRKLLSLDLSCVELCEQQIVDILTHCKKLKYLNLNDTKAKQCFTHSHKLNPISEADIVLRKLKELLVNRSEYKEAILSRLIKQNKGIENLGAASLRLAKYGETLTFTNLTNLHCLDISFQGHGAYEDFNNLSPLPPQLSQLTMSGFVNVNLSMVASQCRRLRSLVLNCSKIDLMFPSLPEIPQTIQAFSCLTRLEIKGGICNLEAFFSSTQPLMLKELVLEGEEVTNEALEKIVNQRDHRLQLIFSSLQYFDLTQCHYLSPWGLEQCRFQQMPSLEELIIKRCSGLNGKFLNSLSSSLRNSSVKLVCDSKSERPRFTDYHAVGIEVVMG